LQRETHDRYPQLLNKTQISFFLIPLHPTPKAESKQTGGLESRSLRPRNERPLSACLRRFREKDIDIPYHACLGWSQGPGAGIRRRQVRYYPPWQSLQGSGKAPESWHGTIRPLPLSPLSSCCPWHPCRPGPTGCRAGPVTNAQPS